jgi:small subunit ribosomal protein S1
MDDGYWEALLRDVEEELDPLWSGGDPDELAALAAPSAAYGARRWGNAGADDGDSEADWAKAEALLASHEPTTVKISGYNRGGLLADFGSLQGFMPASHLLAPVPGAAPEQRAAALATHIGQTLTVRVAEIDRSRCRLILSERLTRENGHADAVLADLQPGQVCAGQVTSLCPFGAFVDLGGFEGLIHISELSWGRVGSPGEVVQPGDHVELMVLEVNPEAKKIALSLKRLRNDPWQGVAARYHIGQVVDAVITNVVNFGAFARLEEGLEGLIHVSELAEGSFMHPRNVIREGDRVRARVLQVDSVKRRVALTLRPADAPLRPRAGMADLHPSALWPAA